MARLLARLFFATIAHYFSVALPPRRKKNPRHLTASGLLFPLPSLVAEHALAAKALQQKALALEARSGSMASENEDLQRRLDAALGEMEVSFFIIFLTQWLHSRASEQRCRVEHMIYVRAAVKRWRRQLAL